MTPAALASRSSRTAVSWTPAALEAPAGGVEAGTLLAAGGHGLADLAGDGTVALARPAGRVELRAARDGVPAVNEHGVTIDRSHAVHGDVDHATGDLAVCGPLAVEGQVAPGRTLTTTGPLRVVGSVDRAVLRAGGELTLEGRAQGAVLAGGAMSALRRRLHDPLHGLAASIDDLLGMIAQLMDATRSRGEVDPARAIRALCAARFGDLEPRLCRARVVVTGVRRDQPGLAASLDAELEAAWRAVTGPERLADPLAHLSRAAGFLAAAVPTRRPLTDAGVRVAAARSCIIDAAGAVRLTGAGAVDCEITAGGDLIAMSSGGVVRDGSLRVGGRVRVREISATQGRPLRVEITAARNGDEVLQAGTVTAGVEVAVAGRTIRFDRRATGVRILVRDGVPVAETDRGPLA